MCSPMSCSAIVQQDVAAEAEQHAARREARETNAGWAHTKSEAVDRSKALRACTRVVFSGWGGEVQAEVP